jgi:hypothetical protein
MWSWTRRQGHPDERALMLAGLEPLEARDPSVITHIATCGSCRAAVASAEGAWAAARASAEADADAVFSEAVLDRQRAHILRRVEQQGHPARVLRFPVSPSGLAGARSVARQWVAAAAAAGLLVGIAAGRFLPAQRGTSSARSAAAARLAPATQTTAAPSGVSDPRHDLDEAFLVDLEMAAASPRIEPLQALDAMTPRINDGRR